MTTTTALERTTAFGHRRLDLAHYDDVYIIGDVHGCHEVLETLLSELSLGSNDLAIFVGDLVRKGPASKAVLDRVRESDRLCSVRGNNEQKFLDNEASLPTLGSSDYRYMESLPIAISWDGGLVVHGGIDPTRPLADHSLDELLTMRAPNGDGYDGPFWFDAYEGPPRVFFGHTVLESPLENEWAVGLDTGCVYGGSLTAYDLRRNQFVSVQANGHVERSTSKIVATDGVRGGRV
jgi:serine/threonine protein phosphatase 1